MVPQQALALANNELTLKEARMLAGKLAAASRDNSDAFIERAFLQILARRARPEELKLCREFLEKQTGHSSSQRARENFIAVLFNHNDFVTIR